MDKRLQVDPALLEYLERQSIQASVMTVVPGSTWPKTKRPTRQPAGPSGIGRSPSAA
jgi:hypothetical protein